MKLKVSDEFKTVILNFAGIPISEKTDKADLLIIDHMALGTSERDGFNEKYIDVFGVEGATSYRLAFQFSNKEITPLGIEREYFIKAAENERKSVKDKIIKELEKEVCKTEELRKVNDRVAEELKKLDEDIDERKDKKEVYEALAEQSKKEYEVYCSMVQELKNKKLLRFLIRLFYRGELE
ncbi:hypothetical protein [Streptococcus suis]|uniref:hypothetical protein n=1 Tax=Streptococcus suis TaxID=1307 RepID=UPI001C97DE07|nr:hypothetical protein [Streptococcus suis]MBY5002400.1 hypothetical protein [Streptococcus suis]MBY5020279.1 hypothetical protein [Streptococcus suis]